MTGAGVVLATPTKHNAAADGVVPGTPADKATCSGDPTAQAMCNVSVQLYPKTSHLQLQL